MQEVNWQKKLKSGTGDTGEPAEASIASAATQLIKSKLLFSLSNNNNNVAATSTCLSSCTKKVTQTKLKQTPERHSEKVRNSRPNSALGPRAQIELKSRQRMLFDVFSSIKF